MGLTEGIGFPFDPRVHEENAGQITTNVPANQSPTTEQTTTPKTTTPTTTTKLTTTTTATTTTTKTTTTTTTTTQTPPAFTPPSKYIENPHSGTCYMRYDSPAVNWWAARDACLNEGHDVRLATFKTSAAAEFLINDHNADKNS